MKKLELGQTITILANLSVLFGILLLVYELAQNRQMMEAQTRHDLSQSIVEQFFYSALDDDLAEIVISVRSQSPVSEAEALRLSWWIRARFRYWEDVHYQYRLDLYDESEFVAQTQGLRGMFGYDDVRGFWRANKASFSAEFRAYVDEIAESSTAGE